MAVVGILSGGIYNHKEGGNGQEGGHKEVTQYPEDKYVLFCHI